MIDRDGNIKSRPAASRGALSARLKKNAL